MLSLTSRESLTSMKKLSLSIVILCFCLAVGAQNTPPTLKARSVIAFYGQRVCIDIDTKDLDGDSVFIGSNTQIPQAIFTNTNSIKQQATGSFCVTPTRGVHFYHLPYTMVFYATDKKDTVFRSFTLDIRNSPYKVRPVVEKLNYNTFRIDVKGDKNEPWQSYNGLEFESIIFDTNLKKLFVTRNQTFTFTAPAYEKYLLYTTYRTAESSTFSTLDTLYPDMNVSVVSPQKNSFTIYPNPTTGKVFIENLPEQIETITVCDILGKEVKRLKTSSNTLTIESLPAGMYWVEIKTLEGVLGRQKVIKN